MISRIIVLVLLSSISIQKIINQSQSIVRVSGNDMVAVAVLNEVSWLCVNTEMEKHTKSMTLMLKIYSYGNPVR